MKRADWKDLRSGDQLGIIKLAPGGNEAARYRGKVVAMREPESWCVVQANWTYGPIDIDGLEFHPGDMLIEWFSPHCPFNAFAILAPEGELRGWYANVTHPAFLEASSPGSDDAAVLVWHDLYLDLIGRSDGSYSIRDRDELDESGISMSDPALYQTILAAGDELALRFTRQQIPFHHGDFGTGSTEVPPP